MSCACEVCGRPATTLVNDLREVEPVLDDEGDAYMRWEVASQHYFCDAHERRSTSVELKAEERARLVRDLRQKRAGAAAC